MDKSGGTYRIGLIVPSSNTTMEIEVPAMLRARERIRLQRFSTHSSRMTMRRVDPDELRRMDDESSRCAGELADADVDVVAYACLVAIMCQGAGYHRSSEDRLHAVASTPVVSSAGALVEALKHIGAQKIAMVTPYVDTLTAQVASYFDAEGIDVVDSLSLRVPDNLAVGRLDPAGLQAHVERLDLAEADALVLSACVQMPSLPVLAAIQRAVDVPVITAASATVWRILAVLGLEPVVPDAGYLLDEASQLPPPSPRATVA